MTKCPPQCVHSLCAWCQLNFFVEKRNSRRPLFLILFPISVILSSILSILELSRLTRVAMSMFSSRALILTQMKRTTMDEIMMRAVLMVARCKDFMRTLIFLVRGGKRYIKHTTVPFYYKKLSIRNRRIRWQQNFETPVLDSRTDLINYHQVQRKNTKTIAW